MKLDPNGYFIITIRNQLITAEHYNYEDQLKNSYSSKDPEELFNKIKDLVNDEHALYLKKELKRAESALKTGDKYIQN